MNGLFLLLKELRSLRNFFRLKPKDREIVVYSEHAVYGQFFHDILEQLRVRQASVVYLTSDPGDPFFQEADGTFRVFYVKNLLSFLGADEIVNPPQRLRGGG